MSIFPGAGHGPRSQERRLGGRVVDGLRLLRSALREIFEESAYERYLERRGTPSSKAAYAEFLREGQAARERRPRCC